MYSFLLKDIKNNKIKKQIKILYYLNNLRDKKSKIKKGGGRVDTFIYTCEKYNFKFRIVKSIDDIFITILNQKYNYDCAFIVINIDQLSKNNNETYAILNGIKGNIDCAVPQLPVFGKGSILLKCIIHFFKNKWKNLWKNNCIIIKYIQLSDNSKKYCENNSDNTFMIYMSDFYTLIKGVPWYYKFGFIHNTMKANKDIEENKNKMDIMKGSDIDIKKIIINSLNNLDKEDKKDILRYEILELHKEKLYNFFRHRQNELLKNSIEKICKNKVGCKLICCIYEEIMKEMNIISIKSKYKDDIYNLYL